MSFHETAQVVLDRIRTGWTRTTVDYGPFNSVGFAEPSPDASAAEASSWIRPSLRMAPAFRAALGPVAMRRESGVLTVQVFTPRGCGGATAYSLAEDLAALFRDYASGGVQFHEPSVFPIAGEAADPWQQVNVEIPLVRDQTR